MQLTFYVALPRMSNFGYEMEFNHAYGTTMMKYNSPCHVCLWPGTIAQHLTWPKGKSQMPPPG